MDNKRSCGFTLLLQGFLCFLLYLALNLGSTSHSLYFLTVHGSPSLTPHLLFQMESVARVYKVKFIINIREPGEEEGSLLSNASRLLQSMKVPWYSAAASKQTILYDNKMLTLVSLNSPLLQDEMPERSASDFRELSQTLEAASGRWLVVVGHHPVVVCEENREPSKRKHVNEPIHHTFLTHRVNAYISRGGCSNTTLEDGVAYISSQHFTNSRPDLSSAFQKKSKIVFLLHRVTAAEFTTYFIDLSGEVLRKTAMQLKGKEAM